MLGEKVSIYMNYNIYLITTSTISINSKYPISMLSLPYS